MTKWKCRVVGAGYVRHIHCQASKSPNALQVLRQSFFLPFGVKTLATTATSHGITQKFLLLGTFSDQVGTFICTALSSPVFCISRRLLSCPHSQSQQHEWDLQP